MGSNFIHAKHLNPPLGQVLFERDTALVIDLVHANRFMPQRPGPQILNWPVNLNSAP
jgi:hypothetical protein